MAEATPREKSGPVRAQPRRRGGRCQHACVTLTLKFAGNRPITKTGQAAPLPGTFLAWKFAYAGRSRPEAYEPLEFFNHRRST